MKKNSEEERFRGSRRQRAEKHNNKFCISSSQKYRRRPGKRIRLSQNAIRAMGYNVSSNIEYIDSMKKQFAMVQAVLGGIGAVSLFVAAIGIANTMMMSIYERTKEIGVYESDRMQSWKYRQMFFWKRRLSDLRRCDRNVLSFLMSAAINALVKGKEMGMTTGQISYIPLWLVLVSLGLQCLSERRRDISRRRRAMKLSPLAAIRNE